MMNVTQLIEDESTDAASNKNLCVLVRYFSKSKKKVETSLLGKAEVISATGENIFEALKSLTDRAHLQLENCIGLGNDGASNMIGQHNSLFSRLKEESPYCILIHCICHSLAICVQNAFDVMPPYLSVLIYDIPSWFSNSSVRREDYKSLYASVIDANSYQAPLPFRKKSTTRWLVQGKVMHTILQNWQELTAYFISAEASTDKRSRYKARVIRDTLSDPRNKLFFHFLVPVIQEFERINAFFQVKEADPQDLDKELRSHHLSLKKCLFDVNGNALVNSRTNFGVKFLAECTLRMTHRECTREQIDQVRNVP